MRLVDVECKKCGACFKDKLIGHALDPTDLTLEEACVTLDEVTQKCDGEKPCVGGEYGFKAVLGVPAHRSHSSWKVT